MHSPRSKLIFDDRCGLCQKSGLFLRGLDWFKTIDFIPFSQAAELVARHHITAQAMEAAIHHVSLSGQVTNGAHALRVFGMKIPLLFPCALLLYLPFVLRLANRLYTTVASRRQTLSRLLRCDAGQCSIHRDS